MELLPADYVLCGLAIVMAVTGLFRGFSGTLGFAVGLVAAVFVGAFAWPYSLNYTTAAWARGAATLVAVLLAFGLVRLIVRKLVNGLLAQPTDALFGAIVGLALGALVPLAWATLGQGLEYSNLVTYLSTRLAPCGGASAAQP